MPGRAGCDFKQALGWGLPERGALSDDLKADGCFPFKSVLQCVLV